LIQYLYKLFNVNLKPQTLSGILSASISRWKRSSGDALFKRSYMYEKRTMESGDH
jgi:hypothetical protein